MNVPLVCKLVSTCMSRSEDKMVYERTKLVRAELDKTKANVHSVHPDVAKAAKEKQKEMLEEIKVLSEQQSKAQAAWQETVRAFKVRAQPGAMRERWRRHRRWIPLLLPLFGFNPVLPATRLLGVAFTVVLAPFPI